MLVAAPLIVLVLGLLAALSTSSGGAPDELVSLPGADRQAPEPPAGPRPVATTPTSVTTTTTPDALLLTPDPIDVTAATPVASADVTDADPVGEPDDAVPSPRNGEGDGDAIAGPPPPTTPTSVPTAPPMTVPASPSTDATFEHTYPAEHEGAVWIRVQASDLESRTIVIRWGPFQREITHRAIWPVTYTFEKGPGPTVPTTVTVADGAGVDVTFGHGDAPPLGAVDVNDGWTTNPRDDGAGPG